jgi:NTE family protein
MTTNVGLVLSGGGARGAYEVGVLSGVVEVLGESHETEALFRVISGTSVGAINGSFLAANAHVRTHHIERLEQLWRSLELRAHLRVDLLGLVGWTTPLRLLRKPIRDEDGIADRFGRSILDPRALEDIVAQTVNWPQLHDNVNEGRIRGLVVAALHIGSGATTMFAELAPGVEWSATNQNHRITKRTRIDVEHVLASAAIPVLFPARRVGRAYYVDGGLRFNTPIAPAIRAGADKLVIITMKDDALDQEVDINADVSEQYPNLVFLLGKVLNALLLDPVAYDLRVLERFNRLMDVIDQTLSPEDRAKISQVLRQERGLPYKKIPTLTFHPSKNVGLLASEHLKKHASGWDVGRFYEWLLARTIDANSTWQADLASYLMFDGAWATTLIELGRSDALAKADEIVRFFSPGQ